MNKLLLFILLANTIVFALAGGSRENSGSVNTYYGDTENNPNGYDGTSVTPLGYSAEGENIEVNDSGYVTPFAEEEWEEWEEGEEEEEEEGECEEVGEEEEENILVEVIVEVDITEEGVECLPVEVEEEEEEEEEEENTEVNISVEVDVTTPTEEGEEEYECVEVPYSEWNSSLIESVINYGTQWNVNKAISIGNLSPNSSWEIKEIKDVCEKEKGDKIYYTFTNLAQVQDGEKCYNFTSTITVRNYNGENFVTKWKYHLVEEETEENNSNGECVAVPSSEWNSPLIQSVINYGTQWNVNKASSRGNFSPSSTWEIKEIKSVCKTVKGDKTYYTFTNLAQVQDGENCYNFTSTMTVRNYNGENFVTKWKYNVMEINNQPNNGGNSGECVAVPSSEWNSPLIQTVINYGTQWNVNKAGSRGNFSPSSTWKIKKINSVCKTVEGDKTYYTFTNLAKVQDGGKSYDFTSTITVRNYNGENFVTKWKYNLVEINNQSNNGDNSGECVAVPSSEWNSPLIQSVINYGTQWNVNKASSRGNFSPSSTWKIKKINNVCKTEQGDKTYYTFTNLAKVQDGGKSYDFTSKMTVRNSNGENFVTKWNYNVASYS